jgi:benzoyl-CoA 2,3-dioxygenase component B
VTGEAEWKAHEREWLPTPEDRAFVASLMGPRDGARQVRELDRAAADGINKQPIEFEYVRFA